MMMPPDRIEQWPLARLKPYARNAKTHDADQVAKIAASMAEFGWTVPVLVAADGELIAGHGRILAAAHLGLKDVPVKLFARPGPRSARPGRPDCAVRVCSRNFGICQSSCPSVVLAK